MKGTLKEIRETRGGFTLAELLIVVAIIMVLVAIAIPVFTGAMKKADDAVAAAQLRSVKAAATSQILTEGLASEDGWTAKAKIDANGNMISVDVVEGTTGAADKAEKDKATNEWTVEAVIKPTDVTTPKP